MFTAMPPHRVLVAAGFAFVRPVVLRAVLAFDRVTMGFSILLMVIVSEALGVVALASGATFIDGIVLGGEVG